MSRTCKVCKTKFEPKYSTVQMTCSVPCAIEYTKQKKQKDWKKRKQVIKKSLKRKQDYEKDLEKVFNQFIRLRDHALPCVSCGAKAGSFKLTAGHFYPAGSYKNLRFNENNVHGQCWWNCNKNRHGNLQEYRIGIISRITEDELKELDRLAQVPRHYSIPELLELIEIYKEKVRILKKNN